MTARKQINRVLVITLVLNVTVALSKIALGIVTGALAITADGFHSLADGASNVIALVANNIAGRPPDANHPYGHERFETLATLGIGLLLLLTVWETLQSVFERITSGGEAELTPLAFAVMLGTLAVNIGVNRYQVARGRALNSQLLLADAAHTGADIYVTLSVLASMAVTVTLGWAWADVVIALVVVVMILKAAWAILRRTGTVLVDTAPLDPAEVRDLLADIPVMQEIVRVRSRGDVDSIRVDVDVEVPREMTADQTAEVNEIVRQRLQDGIPGLSEVEVHFTPADFQPDNHATGVRILAEARGMRTHNLNYQRLDGQGVLDLHVEVPGHLTLSEAHDEVSQLEEQIRARFDEIQRVVSHIEPLAEPGDEARACIEDPRLANRIMSMLRVEFPQTGWHNLRIHGQPRGLTITLHAGLPADISVEMAHDIAEEAERLLRAALPHIDRVTIHTEPGTVHEP